MKMATFSRYAVSGNRKLNLRFQKVRSHGLKQSINIPASRQVHPCSASVQCKLRRLPTRFVFTINGEFKFAACHISCLGMIMGVRCAYGALKFNLNEHYLTVIPQNLTNNAFTGPGSHTFSFSRTNVLLLVFSLCGRYFILANIRY